MLREATMRKEEAWLYKYATDYKFFHSELIVIMTAYSKADSLPGVTHTHTIQLY